MATVPMSANTNTNADTTTAITIPTVIPGNGSASIGYGRRLCNMLRFDGISIAYMLTSSRVAGVTPIQLLVLRCILFGWCIVSWIASSLNPRASYPFVYLTYRKLLFPLTLPYLSLRMMLCRVHMSMHMMCIESFLCITVYFGLQVAITLCHIPLLRQLNNDISLQHACLHYYNSYIGYGTCGIYHDDAPQSASNNEMITTIGALQSRSTFWRISMILINILHLIVTPLAWFVTLVCISYNHIAITSSLYNDRLRLFIRALHIYTRLPLMVTIAC
jgi:hypothetical protein